MPKPATMASGGAISLPKMLCGEDARSWFKRFKVCVAANEWGDEKKLTQVPTLLKGYAWAVYKALTKVETDTYAHLKAALLAQLSPDMDEERLGARDELARRRLRKDVESIDELARDLEKLLEKASPDLPQATKSTELCFHLINALDWSSVTTFQNSISAQYRNQDTTLPLGRQFWHLWDHQTYMLIWKQSLPKCNFQMA